jgi:hypothetical protein
MLTRQQVLGVAASILVVGAAITAWRPAADVGYLEIKTVPVAPVTQTTLYLDTVKLGPIRKGNAILRQPIGILKLQTDGVAAGMLAPLCNVVVKRNRITTVTVSVLEHPPRCQCRNNGNDAAHACVS